MKLPASVLFVGAHCDDVELFAGGLLAKLAYGRATKIGVLVFSDHRGIVSDAAAAEARGELRDNLAWLSDASGAPIVDHTDVLLPACSGAFEAERATIYAALERLRASYDLVVSHCAADTNQDHRQVAAETARVFKAHATLLAGEFPNNDVGGFAPAVYVELDERDVAAKARMVSRYRSQDFGGRPYLDEELVRALARVRGSQIRAKWAEAFAVGARVVVRG